MNVLILVVDDEPDVTDLFRQQFRRELRAGRFAMAFAQSAPEALARIATVDGPSLILMFSDINMPGMTGLELLPLVRAARPDVPVIMITAYGDPATREAVLAAGAVGLITKPIDFALLKAEIDRRLAAVTDGMIAGPPSAKILVVDDEPDLQALILQKFRRPIREKRLAFLFARDGQEALECLAENRDVDVVVSDINMPRMDGLTLLGKIQDLAERPSTVIVSAYGDMANIRTAMNRGAFDFLTKPIDFADLETTIERTLRHVALLREGQRRQLLAERAHASLARYFSPNLAEQLAGDASGLELGGNRRDVASLFTDIAGFTGLVESLDPSQLAEILNGYFAEMTDVVFAHEGTVAKIVGDALHLLFGAPGDQPDHAARAVACALALDGTAEAFRARWRERGIEIGVTRIGVHAGPAIVGNFGGGRYFDYTAYGDTINTSARLENANKAFGTRICVSESVVIRAAQFRGRPLGDLLLRGKQDSLRAFEPLTETAYDEPSLIRYREAFARLEAGEAGALAAFAALVGLRPDDGVAAFHLKRLLNGASGTRVEVR